MKKRMSVVLSMALVMGIMGQCAIAVNAASKTDDDTLNITLINQGSGQPYIAAYKNCFEKAEKDLNIKVNLVDGGWDANQQANAIQNAISSGADGIVIQEPCAHSQKDNSVNQKHLKRDIKGKNVLYSRHFFYFGCNAPKVPKELLSICCTSRNYSYKEVSEELIKDFVSWLESNYTVGIHGDPCNWKKYKLPKLDIYDDGIK